MPILDIIKNRWSPRTFKNDAISRENIQTIIEAASLSFSAANLQPWHYTYSHHGSKGFENILNTLHPSNQEWAKNAAILMIASSQKSNEKGNNIWADLDLGSANMALALQALSMDIYSHFMGGFDFIKAHELTQLDEQFQPLTIVALGYKAEADILPEPHKSREIGHKSRKGIQHISHEI
ncbi:MAG: nitroreductase family protein [Chitinophagales bacterium]|nr:nitroreductase family protein [Chitinophagales bacterium]